MCSLQGRWVGIWGALVGAIEDSCPEVTSELSAYRHLPMMAALLHGRTHLNFQEFRQQGHLTFFLHVLGLLGLLQPHVFQSAHQGALWDCLRSFVRLLLVGPAVL